MNRGISSRPATYRVPPALDGVGRIGSLDVDAVVREGMTGLRGRSPRLVLGAGAGIGDGSLAIALSSVEKSAVLSNHSQLIARLYGYKTVRNIRQPLPHVLPVRKVI